MAAANNVPILQMGNLAAGPFVLGGAAAAAAAAAAAVAPLPPAGGLMPPLGAAGGFGGGGGGGPPGGGPPGGIGVGMGNNGGFIARQTRLLEMYRAVMAAIQTLLNTDVLRIGAQNANVPINNAQGQIAMGISIAQAMNALRNLGPDFLNREVSFVRPSIRARFGNTVQLIAAGIQQEATNHVNANNYILAAQSLAEAMVNTENANVDRMLRSLVDSAVDMEKTLRELLDGVWWLAQRSGRVFNRMLDAHVMAVEQARNIIDVFIANMQPPAVPAVRTTLTLDELKGIRENISQNVVLRLINAVNDERNEPLPPNLHYDYRPPGAPNGVRQWGILDQNAWGEILTTLARFEANRPALRQMQTDEERILRLRINELSATVGLLRELMRSAERRVQRFDFPVAAVDGEGADAAAAAAALNLPLVVAGDERFEDVHSRETLNAISRMLDMVRDNTAWRLDFPPPAPGQAVAPRLAWVDHPEEVGLARNLAAMLEQLRININALDPHAMLFVGSQIANAALLQQNFRLAEEVRGALQPYKSLVERIHTNVIDIANVTSGALLESQYRRDASIDEILRIPSAFFETVATTVRNAGAGPDALMRQADVLLAIRDAAEGAMRVWVDNVRRRSDDIANARNGWNMPVPPRLSVTVSNGAAWENAIRDKLDALFRPVTDSLAKLRLDNRQLADLTRLVRQLKSLIDPRPPAPPGAPPGAGPPAYVAQDLPTLHAEATEVVPRIVGRVTAIQQRAQQARDLMVVLPAVDEGRPLDMLDITVTAVHQACDDVKQRVTQFCQLVQEPVIHPLTPQSSASLHTLSAWLTGLAQKNVPVQVRQAHQQMELYRRRYTQLHTLMSVLSQVAQYFKVGEAELEQKDRQRVEAAIGRMRDALMGIRERAVAQKIDEGLASAARTARDSEFAILVNYAEDEANAISGDLKFRRMRARCGTLAAMINVMLDTFAREDNPQRPNAVRPVYTEWTKIFEQVARDVHDVRTTLEGVYDDMRAGLLYIRERWERVFPKRFIEGTMNEWSQVYAGMAAAAAAQPQMREHPLFVFAQQYQDRLQQLSELYYEHVTEQMAELNAIRPPDRLARGERFRALNNLDALAKKFNARALSVSVAKMKDIVMEWRTKKGDLSGQVTKRFEQLRAVQEELDNMLPTRRPATYPWYTDTDKDLLVAPFTEDGMFSLVMRHMAEAVDEFKKKRDDVIKVAEDTLVTWNPREYARPNPSATAGFARLEDLVRRTSLETQYIEAEYKALEQLSSATATSLGTRFTDVIDREHVGLTRALQRSVRRAREVIERARVWAKEKERMAEMKFDTAAARNQLLYDPAGGARPNNNTALVQFIYSMTTDGRLRPGEHAAVVAAGHEVMVRFNKLLAFVEKVSGTVPVALEVLLNTAFLLRGLHVGENAAMADPGPVNMDSFAKLVIQAAMLPQSQRVALPAPAQPAAPPQPPNMGALVDAAEEDIDFSTADYADLFDGEEEDDVAMLWNVVVSQAKRAGIQLPELGKFVQPLAGIHADIREGKTLSVERLKQVNRLSDMQTSEGKDIGDTKYDNNDFIKDLRLAIANYRVYVYNHSNGEGKTKRSLFARAFKIAKGAAKSVWGGRKKKKKQSEPDVLVPLAAEEKKQKEEAEEKSSDSDSGEEGKGEVLAAIPHIKRPDNQPNETIYLTHIGRVAINVIHGDMLEEKADAYVNSANSNLQHGGGIARAIAQHAGQEFVADCKGQYVFTGSAFTTRAGGTLKCRRVIHTVPPVYDAATDHTRTLAAAVTSALREADRHKLSVVCMPSLGTAIFGWPLNLAVPVVVDAIRDYIMSTPDTQIKELRIVDKLNDTANAFWAELYKRDIARAPSAPVLLLPVRVATPPALVPAAPAALAELEERGKPRIEEKEYELGDDAEEEKKATPPPADSGAGLGGVFNIDPGMGLMPSPAALAAAAAAAPPVADEKKNDAARKPDAPASDVGKNMEDHFFPRGADGPLFPENAPPPAAPVAPAAPAVAVVAPPPPPAPRRAPPALRRAPPPALAIPRIGLSPPYAALAEGNALPSDLRWNELLNAADEAGLPVNIFHARVIPRINARARLRAIEPIDENQAKIWANRLWRGIRNRKVKRAIKPFITNYINAIVAARDVSNNNPVAQNAVANIAAGLPPGGDPPSSSSSSDSEEEDEEKKNNRRRAAPRGRGRGVPRRASDDSNMFRRYARNVGRQVGFVAGELATQARGVRNMQQAFGDFLFDNDTAPPPLGAHVSAAAALASAAARGFGFALRQAWRGVNFLGQDAAAYYVPQPLADLANALRPRTLVMPGMMDPAVPPHLRRDHIRPFITPIAVMFTDLMGADHAGDPFALAWNHMAQFLYARGVSREALRTFRDNEHAAVRRAYETFADLPGAVARVQAMLRTTRVTEGKVANLAGADTLYLDALAKIAAHARRLRRVHSPVNDDEDVIEYNCPFEDARRNNPLAEAWNALAAFTYGCGATEQALIDARQREHEAALTAVTEAKTEADLKRAVQQVQLQVVAAISVLQTQGYIFTADMKIGLRFLRQCYVNAAVEMWRMIKLDEDGIPVQILGADDDEEKHDGDALVPLAGPAAPGALQVVNPPAVGVPDLAHAMRLVMIAAQAELARADTFNQGLQKIMTPMGSSCVLRAWAFLQQSSPVFRFRSLAQMIFCANWRLQMNFAVLCANFFADTDGRRPTRHAKSSEYFNKLAEEQRVLAHYILKHTFLNRAVDRADDLTADPWIFKGDVFQPTALQ